MLTFVCAYEYLHLPKFLTIAIGVNILRTLMIKVLGNRYSPGGGNNSKNGTCTSLKTASN